MNRIVFTSELSEVSALTSKSEVGVQLYAGERTLLFSVRYKVYGGSVTIHGLDSIIENHLKDSDRIYSDFTLIIDQMRNYFTAVHCDSPMPQPAVEWLRTHFLLPDRHIVIPAGFGVEMPVPFYLDAPASAVITAAYRDDNGKTVTESQRISLVAGWGELSVAPWTFSHTPLYQTVTVGDRQATFSVIPVDVGPDGSAASTYNVFLFRNQFNADQLMLLKGITSQTPEVSSESGIVNGVMRKFAIKDQMSSTLSVTDLTMDEAIEVGRLNRSHLVSLISDMSSHIPHNPLDRIMITDIDGTIHDSTEELCNVKITYHKSKR